MSRRVVVVDDDADVLALFGIVLADDGYEAVVTQDGAAALAAILGAAPAAVILDVRLDTPDRGWRIVEAMRADPALARTPVIVTSADPAALRQHAAGLHGGDYAFLPKPFELDELSRLLRLHAGPADAG